mmetsp:Transcript_162996/g.522678  ORF Transcript_162996/g.522678 Transcript_162996/m.522678 type:complete len:261 (-) Transcript_162996:190-972(-)
MVAASRPGARLLCVAAAACAVALLGPRGAFVTSPDAAGRAQVATAGADAVASASSGRRLVLGGAASAVVGLGESLQGAAPAGAEEPEAPYDVVVEVALGGIAKETKSFTLKVHPEWAPIGAAQFKKLIEKGWFEEAAIFRVVPGFIAQFGLPAKAQSRLENIRDDPVKVSNKKGTMVFATAGANTRTSQLFINYGDNAFLDKQGFSPFAEVVGDGLKVVEQFNAEYKESPNQGSITSQGNVYLDKNFPRLSKITKMTIQK